MTSFVTDVLITAGKFEKVNLNEKVSEIRKEITRLKYDVIDFMDDNYNEFTSKLTRNQHLAVKTKKLIEEMSALQNRIDDQMKIDLSGSIKELNGLSQALRESNISLQLANQLLTLNEYIKSIKKFQEEKRYVDTAKTLRRMQALLDNPETDPENLDIYTAIKQEYANLYSIFLTDASRLLHERICWSGAEDGKDWTVVTLTIKDSLEDLQDLICGLHYVDNLANDLHKFSITLMDCIISPIINDHCSVYVVNERVFTVEILDRKKIPDYQSVLYNLKLLFKFLHQHFNITVEEETFLKKTQPHFLNRLADALTTNCISRTIPTSSADLKNFEPIVEAINEFQDYLVEIGFISDDQLFLSEYTKNIDKLFVDRICQELLVKARSIMKKDLHDSIKYEPQGPLHLPHDHFEDSGCKMNRKLSATTFQLPKCQISKNAKETLDLAKNILDEACHNSDTCAIRLFSTCRNVFEMYTGLVPEHHKKFLETIPQQVALFYNNCMYLAHHLLTLAHEYRDKLPESLQKFNLTFADQSLVLRDTGVEHFLEHMRYQRNIITDILKESGLSALGQASELHPNTERALRQCIRQLELLKTVWFDVLPIDIYCKAVGCITNSMIDDLIIRVTSVEDIPKDVATDLVTLFVMVTKRAPLIFPDPDTVNQHIRKWNKFLELIKVLGASLKEIEVRWGNGKGPLAHEFTASQVKQLIRALFQNTERRSSLLASIK